MVVVKHRLYIFVWIKKRLCWKYFFNNKNVKDFDNIQLAKMRAIHMSIVFQDLRLFKEHNTFQNIEIKEL